MTDFSKSPCVSECKAVTFGKTICCSGCGRLLEEIVSWSTFTPEMRKLANTAAYFRLLMYTASTEEYL